VGDGLGHLFQSVSFIALKKPTQLLSTAGYPAEKRHNCPKLSAKIKAYLIGPDD
jgi:hypothetical protein